MLIKRQQALARIDLAKVIRPGQVIGKRAWAAGRQNAGEPPTSRHYQRGMCRRCQWPEPNDFTPAASLERADQRHLRLFDHRRSCGLTCSIALLLVRQGRCHTRRKGAMSGGRLSVTDTAEQQDTRTL